MNNGEKGALLFLALFFGFILFIVVIGIILFLILRSGDDNNDDIQKACNNVFNELYSDLDNWAFGSISGSPLSYYESGTSGAGCQLILDANSIRYTVINNSTKTIRIKAVKLNTSSSCSDKAQEESITGQGTSFDFPPNGNIYQSECLYPTASTISVLYNNLQLQFFTVVSGVTNANVSKTYNDVNLGSGDYVTISVTKNITTTIVEIVINEDSSGNVTAVLKNKTN